MALHHFDEPWTNFRSLRAPWPRSDMPVSFTTWRICIPLTCLYCVTMWSKRAGEMKGNETWIIEWRCSRIHGYIPLNKERLPYIVIHFFYILHWYKHWCGIERQMWLTGVIRLTPSRLKHFRGEKEEVVQVCFRPEQSPGKRQIKLLHLKNV